MEMKTDAHHWILGVIDSAKNYHHFNACTRLIINFKNMYGDLSLANNLLIYLENKRNEKRTI